MAIQEDFIDFNKICRLCLMEEPAMTSIYNESDKHSNTVPLPIRIMACISIDLNSVDGLPSHICSTCRCQVDEWYKFKGLCEAADAILKDCLKNEPVHIETISQIRSRAQEIRRFFNYSNLVKLEGLNPTMGNLNSQKDTEIAVKNEDQVNTILPKTNQKYLIYMNPEGYFKWLQTEYKLSTSVSVRKLPNSNADSENPFPCYEIAFDSYIQKSESKTHKEKILMEVGDCQILAITPAVQTQIPEVNSKNDCLPHEYHDDFSKIYPKTANPNSPNTKSTNDNVLANYKRTQEYLENAYNRRHNTYEELIENVLYTYRLDDDRKLDVVNIVEGVTEPNVQRGFRYTCMFCSKIVLNKLIYDKHIRKTHLNYLVCKVCDKQLYSVRNFLIHTKTHLGVYTFTCPVCGKGLTRASIFKSHMMYHYHGKVQKCQICQKKFRDIFALRRHVQLHDKKIEYVCELCGFGTHVRSNLEYHMRTHANEKSYMCELCGKRFTAPQSLRHHLRTHGPNFPCLYCKRMFKHESKFINHLEQNHS